jgi:hypothetical protein
LLLFFRKEESSCSEQKEATRLLFLVLGRDTFQDTGKTAVGARVKAQ